VFYTPVYKSGTLSIKTWRAAASYNGKGKHIGCYATEIEAALAYNEFAIKHFGEFARLNIIKSEVA
jgi:hypothetical protein